MGNRLEPVIFDLYERDTSNKLERDPAMIRSKKYPWMIANIDAYATDKEGNDFVVEAKSAVRGDEWGEQGTDNIPMHYLLQVAHYAIVCEVERVDIAMLLGNRDFRIYTYFSDSNLEEQIIKATKHFWDNYIVTKTPPMPSSTKEAADFYDADNDKIIDATEEIEDKIYMLERIKTELSELKNKEASTKTDIANFMGDATTIQDSNGFQLITFKESTTKRFDTTKFKAIHKDLYNSFTNDTTSRRMLVKIKSK
jgi:predicted phage-related endonuclease